MKGHSMRKGRSRCCSKIGPSSRAHKRKSVVRRQTERQGGRSQSDPMDAMDAMVSEARPDSRRSS